MDKSDTAELAEDELARMLSQDPLTRPKVRVTRNGCQANAEELRAWREAQSDAKS